MKQLFKIDKMVGKTIKKSCTNWGGHELWIRFTDDTFIIFHSSSRSEGFGQSYEVLEVQDYPVDNTDHELVELGFITEREYDCACKERERKYKEEEEKREQEQKQQNREKELLLLKQLKEKYENR